MSGAVERRGVLAAIGALSLFPLWSRLSAAGLSGEVAGKFVLERTVRRGLADGHHIEAARRFAVAFAPEAGGETLVTGTQISVRVEAPPALAALAAMEERREEDGFFPLRLDQHGLILPSPGEAAFSELPEAVASAALAYARERSAGLDAAAASRQFIADLSDRSHRWLTLMPRDLFFPEPRDRSVSREIALADGTKGVIRMRETAQADPATGLLASFARVAETGTQNLARTGSETWTLSRTVS